MYHMSNPENTCEKSTSCYFGWCKNSDTPCNFCEDFLCYWKQTEADPVKPSISCLLLELRLGSNPTRDDIIKSLQSGRVSGYPPTDKQELGYELEKRPDITLSQILAILDNPVEAVHKLKETRKKNQHKLTNNGISR